MAGAFGYEKEHYDLSMKIGEMVLFSGSTQCGRRYGHNSTGDIMPPSHN
ncbi:MAG: hypothetical protein MZV63_21360 [Marinilabiliales bacterium]|nr:hypothetical protein [Marinilabiliales bacterium]